MENKQVNTKYETYENTFGLKEDDLVSTRKGNTYKIVKRQDKWYLQHNPALYPIGYLNRQRWNKV